MSNFLIYSNKLRQWVRSLSPEQAQDFINDAWRDIREAYDQWSFLEAEEYWLAPAALTLTGLGVTQFGFNVTLSHSALLQIAGLNNPPITQRQIKLGVQGGPIYEIASTDAVQVSGGAINSAATLLTVASAPFTVADVNKKIIIAGAGVGGANLETTIASFVSPTQINTALAASTTVLSATVSYGSIITLGRMFAETTTSSTTGLLYRIYYSPLTTDFRRLDHITDVITGYPFGFLGEIEPVGTLDQMDPWRSAVTEPYRIFFHHYDQTTKLPVWELWPGPTVQRAYKVTFMRQGQAFSARTDSLPPTLTEELLLVRARWLAYEWAAANDPDPKNKAQYSGLMQTTKARYSTQGQPGRELGLLDQAIKNDEDISTLQGKRRPPRSGPGWPVDSNFLQSHAFPGWWRG